MQNVTSQTLSPRSSYKTHILWRIFSPSNAVSVAAAILEKVGKPNIKLQMVWTKSLLTKTWKESSRFERSLMFFPGCLSLANHGREPDAKHAQVFGHNWWVNCDTTKNNQMWLLLGVIDVPKSWRSRLDGSAGHVQIAQVPGRNEPDSAGELNYRYLLDTLESCGYQGYVGCEYKPLGECRCLWLQPILFLGEEVMSSTPPTRSSDWTQWNLARTLECLADNLVAQLGVTLSQLLCCFLLF